ncbi:hypothetical protein [Streptomyces sp. NPDC008240]|uniref:hypothetical protein n=1 Tax=Streptomyces sp. NPDC008240 TaxID=3364822 RepID=UPI0036EAA789
MLKRRAHSAAASRGTAKWPPSDPARAVPPARPSRMALDIQPTASVEVPGGASAVTVRWSGGQTGQARGADGRCPVWSLC